MEMHETEGSSWLTEECIEWKAEYLAQMKLTLNLHFKWPL